MPLRLVTDTGSAARMLGRVERAGDEGRWSEVTGGRRGLRRCDGPWSGCAATARLELAGIMSPSPRVQWAETLFGQICRAWRGHGWSTNLLRENGSERD